MWKAMHVGSTNDVWVSAMILGGHFGQGNWNTSTYISNTGRQCD